MNRNEVAALYHYFCYSQEELFTKVKYDLVHNYNYTNLSVGEGFVIAYGTIPIALVAHLDTVFHVQPTSFFYDNKEQVLWSPDGLGADDRAGVIMIYQLLNEGYRPTIIFTKDEEMGGIGAEEICNQLRPTELNDKVHFFIQLDRAGAKDCVFYESGNNTFHKYIENFGFEQAEGIFSDISFLCPYFGIDGVNLSVGGYNSHSYTEYLNFKDFSNTLLKVRDILNETKIPKFSYYERSYFYCMGCGRRLKKTTLENNHSPFINYYCPRCYKEYLSREVKEN